MNIVLTALRILMNLRAKYKKDTCVHFRHLHAYEDLKIIKCVATVEVKHEARISWNVFIRVEGGDASLKDMSSS